MTSPGFFFTFLLVRSQLDSQARYSALSPTGDAESVAQSPRWNCRDETHLVKRDELFADETGGFDPFWSDAFDGFNYPGMWLEGAINGARVSIFPTHIPYEKWGAGWRYERSFPTIYLPPGRMGMYDLVAEVVKDWQFLCWWAMDQPLCGPILMDVSELEWN